MYIRYCVIEFISGVFAFWNSQQPVSGPVPHGLSDFLYEEEEVIDEGKVNIPLRGVMGNEFPVPIINFEFWDFFINFNFVISITLLTCSLVCNTLIHFVSNIDFIGGLHNTREHDVVLPHTSVTDTISGRYRCFYEVDYKNVPLVFILLVGYQGMAVMVFSTDEQSKKTLVCAGVPINSNKSEQLKVKECKREAGAQQDLMVILILTPQFCAYAEIIEVHKTTVLWSEVLKTYEAKSILPHFEYISIRTFVGQLVLALDGFAPSISVDSVVRCSRVCVKLRATESSNGPDPWKINPTSAPFPTRQRENAAIPCEELARLQIGSWCRGKLLSVDRCRRKSIRIRVVGLEDSRSTETRSRGRLMI
ncbi:hypothetical protein LXL04_013614 [Taraxacum kok-saghyz]